MKHLFPYDWKLADGYPAPGIEPNGLKVFGTFICGGGSTMGYKLAGYEHLGGVEIDEKVSAIYNANHHPKYLYTEDLRIGDYVFVGQTRLYHPNVEFDEPTYQIGDIGNVLCLTAGDFVTATGHLPKGAVVDMELAYIAAFGFRRLTAIKYVSDNLNLKQYSRTSSSSHSADGTPAAGGGPA